jgi:DNA-binding YbaB/EbfC family protein
MKINPMDLLKNAKKFQEQMGDLQQKMDDVVVVGSAGGGMVEIEVNGRLEVLSVRLEPDFVNADNVEMLQDLIKYAFTDAAERVKAEVSSEVGGLVSGLGGDFAKNFPGGSA